MVGMKRFTTIILFSIAAALAFGLDFPSAVVIPNKPYTDLRDAKITTGTDITARFAACIASGNRSIYIPEGTYYLTHLDLPSGTKLVGAGIDRTILHQVASTSARYPEGDAMLGLNLLDSGCSSDTSTNLKNVYISDMTLEGTCDVDGFYEIGTLLGMQAVSHVTVERVKFKAFQGDGMSVWSGTASAVERHSENIVVQDCQFDGVNHLNRQGISVYDCNNFLAENCLFENTTLATMPAAFDVEGRGYSWVVQKNIKVKGGTFRNIGPNNEKPGWLYYTTVDNTTNTTPHQNIGLENCTFENCAGFMAATFASAPANAPPYGIYAKNCTVSSCPTDILWYGINGISVENCTFNFVKGRILLGNYLGNDKQVHDITFDTCSFNQCGSSNATSPYGAVVQLDSGYDLRLDKCVFIDCGNSPTASGTLVAAGWVVASSSNVSLKDCRVYNTLGRSKALFGAGFYFTKGQSVFRDNLIFNTGSYDCQMFLPSYLGGVTDDGGILTSGFFAGNTPMDFPVGTTKFYCASSPNVLPDGQNYGIIETTIFPGTGTFQFALGYQIYRSTLGFGSAPSYLRQASGTPAVASWGTWIRND
jgi:hypothetical protein